MYYIEFISYFFFFRNRLRRWLYFRTSTFTWEVTGRNCVFLSWHLHYAAKDSKDINLYRFHMLISSHSSQHLDIPSVSTIRFTEIRKSYHTSFGAFLMHFWCTLDSLLIHFSFFLHFTNSAKIQKNTQNLLD